MRERYTLYYMPEQNEYNQQLDAIFPEKVIIAKLFLYFVLGLCSRENEKIANHRVACVITHCD